MADGEPISGAPGVFQHPEITAKGERRAHVRFTALDTLWINTGTLCNIECAHCYIESSPANDRLAYFRLRDAKPLLDEARAMGAREIGFTGGEPFMNPEMVAMARASLERGFSVLILTNAMRPMQRPRVLDGLIDLNRDFGERLALRVSLDHFDPALHDEERGAGAFAASLEGLQWLARNGLRIAVAGRTRWGDDEDAMRAGFATLFTEHDIPIEARDPARLVLFPELDEAAPTPEITEACWSILGKSPDSLMCANARMAVLRKGAARPVILACTLLPYTEGFEMGETLGAARSDVALNHPHCSKFCVLGGASCSA